MAFLRFIFILTFLFPFIPGILVSDIQPLFIVVGAICFFVSSDRVLFVPMLLLTFLLFYSILFFDELTIKVLVSIIGYVVTFEVFRRVDFAILSRALWVYFSITLVGALIHYVDLNFWGEVRETLSLRNSNYEYYSQFAPEPSMYYIQLIAIYAAIVWFGDYKLRVMYAITSIVTFILGSDLALLLLLIPVAVELSLLFFTKEKLFFLGNLASFFILFTFGACFLLFPDLFMVFIEYFHRSEQVRIYDVGQIYYSFTKNPIGMSEYKSMMVNFSLDYPGRFREDSLGSTSALSNIIYSIGGVGFLFFIFIIRFYFKYLGIFLLSISSTIGLSWFPLALIICRKRNCNA